MEGEEVWVVTTHTGWGEDADVMGVYVSKEAAQDAMEAQPNMRVCDKLDTPGEVCGEPIDKNRRPHVWALAEPMKVQGRKAVATS